MGNTYIKIRESRTIIHNRFIKYTSYDIRIPIYAVINFDITVIRNITL